MTDQSIQQYGVCYQWFKQQLIMSVSKPSISYRSQINEDTVEPSVPARDINIWIIMHLVNLHVPTSCRSVELNPDLRSLAAAQAKRTAVSDLCHCATGAAYTRAICVQKYFSFYEQWLPHSWINFAIKITFYILLSFRFFKFNPSVFTHKLMTMGVGCTVAQTILPLCCK